VKRSSKIGISIGGIVAALSMGWTVTTSVVALAAQVEANTGQIQAVVMSLEIGRVDDLIADLQSERRELRRELRRDPENDLVIDQMDMLGDEIEKSKAIRECITNPDQDVCE